ncbi:MAG TPA: CoA pyrophosphatase [Methylomirabilota bacterium]|nr:CoA pyrophosphatase [Methylomirabilota bacterium]
MTIDELAAITRARLAERRRRVVDSGHLISAAVLVPIVDRGEPHLVFAKRSERVGHHKGQISFPGGTVCEADRTFLDCALRECEEEIGLPPASVEALGTLDDTETVATQFVITPFVGRVEPPTAWRPDGGEIEKVIEVPWAALVDRRTFREEIWERNGVRRPVYFYDWQGETIWGATARILKHYIDLVEGQG